MNKVLVTGSRKCIDVNFVFGILKKELKEGDTIIQGGATGVDSIALAWANNKIHKLNSITIKPLYPSKKEYYLHRNAEMIGMCDRVIAIWDGKSRGTEFTIRYTRKRGIDIKVFKL